MISAHKWFLIDLNCSYLNYHIPLHLKHVTLINNSDAATGFQELGPIQPLAI
jgi:hypothetical protein